MTENLTIETLGHLRIHMGDQQPIRFVSRRAELLLVYLAITHRPHTRDTLATLLWDDREQKQSLANLRSLLNRLPKPIKPFLAINRQSVQLKHEAPIAVDALQFEAMIKEAETVENHAIEQRESALTLYQGDFLAGVHLRDSFALVEWMALQREKFGRIAQTTRHFLALTYLHQRRYADGVRHARTLIQTDALHEGNHRLLMRLYARSGQRAKALQQFDTCRQLLAEELAIHPSDETVTLADRIRHAQATLPFVVPLGKTKFVGRQSLLQSVHRVLGGDGARLLTLVGMGGSGKTRLALQIAHDRQGDYLNGIFFVPLTSVTTQTGVWSALGDTINFLRDGDRQLSQQLVEHFQDHEALLIFDNFEQVVEAGVGVIDTLLNSCQRVQIIITSRERLRLRTEQLIQVGSLTQRADAVALFQLYAPRTIEDEAAIWQICQLVGGLPLAIELAASAVAYHSLDQISAEIKTNLTFLATNLRDVPSRHRSITAVFDYSWQLLTEQEQTALTTCSAFLGGFTPEAAAALGVKRPILHALVDKSLLYLGENGRFWVHELFREFSAEKVSDPPLLETQVSDYFVRFLRDSMVKLTLKNLASIGRDWENIEAALLWAAAKNNPLAESAIDAVDVYFQANNDYRRGIDLFCRMLARIPTGSVAAGRVWLRQAGLLILISELDRAEEALTHAQKTIPQTAIAEQALLAYQQGQLFSNRSRFSAAVGQFERSQALCPEETEAFNPTSARFAMIRPLLDLGQTERAVALAYQVVAEFEAQGKQRLLARARVRLADVIEKQGDWQSAEKILHQTIESQRAMGDEVGLARTLGLMADKLGWRDQLDEAIVYCQQSIDIYHRCGIPLSIAIQTGNLGTYYHIKGDLAEARSLYEESLRLSKRLDDRLGVSVMLTNLAEVCEDSGQVTDAIAFYEDGLRLAQALDLKPQLLRAVAGLALTKILVVDGALAHRLAVWVKNHAQTDPATHEYLKLRWDLVSAETLPQENPTFGFAQAIEITLNSP